MCVGIGGSSCGIEAFDPIAFQWKRGGAISRERDLGEPRGKVFSAHFVDVGMAINFYVVPRLDDFDAIKHI